MIYSFDEYRDKYKKYDALSFEEKNILEGDYITFTLSNAYFVSMILELDHLATSDEIKEFESVIL